MRVYHPSALIIGLYPTTRYTNAWIIPSIAEGQQQKRAAQRAAFDSAARTDTNLHYVGGDGKLLSLGDGWYDATSGYGVHPSSIAHLHIAQYVAATLKPILEQRE